MAASAQGAEPPARREVPRFELAAQAGLSVPASDSEEVSSGPTLGGVALYRPTAGFAFGASGDVSQHAWYDDRLTVTTVAANLRLYAAMPETSELYASLLVGRGNVAGSGGSSCSVDQGFSFGATLGVDRYVARFFRLGGQLGYQTSVGAGGMACQPIYSPSAGRSAPIVAPGFTLRLVGTLAG